MRLMVRVQSGEPPHPNVDNRSLLMLLKNVAIFVESIYHYQDFQSYLLFPASDFFDDGLLTSSSSNVDNNIVYGIV